jgi:CRP/FNR family transcriptional regulator, dissimilatory nitrate respiration regulator
VSVATHAGEIALGVSEGRKGRARRSTRATFSEPPSLREIALFSEVDEDTLARLTLEAKFETLEDGVAIFRQGDPVGAFVVILHGFVKMLRMASCGDETLIGIRTDGETVGEPPTTPREVNSMSAETIGRTFVLKFPAVRFSRLMHESPSLCAAVAHDGKQKIAALVAEIESLKAQSADQRLAYFILSLCPPGEEHCRFRLPYDKRLIAAKLGVKQETLSRAFAKLREHGVRTETRDVIVESVARLNEQCEQLGRQNRLPSERAEPAPQDAA